MEKEICTKCGAPLGEDGKCANCDVAEQTQTVEVVETVEEPAVETVATEDASAEQAQTEKPKKLKGKAKKQWVKSLSNEDKIKYHQKRLIPVNIVVCVLCLVAALTLIFTPFIKIDLGKIISSKEVQTSITEMMPGGEDGGDQGGSSGGSDSDNSVNGMISMMLPILTTFLDEMEGKNLAVSLSAFDTLKISQSAGGVKDFAVDTVSDIATTLFNTIKSALEKDSVKTTLSDTFLMIYVNQIAAEFEISSNTLSDNETAIKDILHTIDTMPVDSENDMKTVATNLINKLLEIKPADKVVSSDDKNGMIEFITSLYTETMELAAENNATITFGSEAIAASMISQMLSAEMVDQLLSGSDEQPAEPTPYFTYSAWAQSLNTDNIATKISQKLEDKIDGNATLSSISDYLAYVGYVFCGFAGIWFILFLFAFIHTFTKNKRFCTWYVKLACWIPCLIWLIITLVGSSAFWGLIGQYINLGATFTEMQGMLIGAMAGIKSFTWISGLCLVILYIVSIFWAFPIKHKIRKAKKAIKKQKKQLKKQEKLAAKN